MAKKIAKKTTKVSTKETTKKKKLTKKRLDELNIISEKWVQKHGGCSFDFTERTIKLFDGGLFAIDFEKVKRQKFKGFKKLDNGCREVIFSKKKYTTKEYYGSVWFEEIDETINYLKSLKRFLNKEGFKTKIEYNPKFINEIDKISNFSPTLRVS